MILSIFAFGQPVLKKVASSIDQNYPDLNKLISNMWDTMYHAEGVGLAAPQIGLAIRLFVIDTIQLRERGRVDMEDAFKKVFINAQILEETGEHWAYEEGCLSIPGIRGNVERNPTIRIKYLDENFVEHEESFSGMNARVIQHEYDHIEGKLFVEKLAPLKKQLIRGKLENIKKGKIEVDYKMKFV
jgi:peptide deformylase